MNERTKVRRELFAEGMEQLASSYNVCLWAGGSCKEQAIRAHSVQNSRVLETLSRNGHVIMPRLEIRLRARPTFVFREVGRNKATTFSGLCQSHDHELFLPIEINAIDRNNPQHLFLLAYRAVLKEAHVSRKAAIDVHSVYLQGAERGLYPKDEPSAAGMLAVERLVSAYAVEETKREFDKALLTSEWHRIGHWVFTFTIAPSIAVNSMFSTDIWSREFNGPAFVMLNVLPLGDETSVVFSYLEPNWEQAHQAFGHLLSAKAEFQRYELSKIILRKCENIVIAPALYEKFSVEQKQAISTYFYRNTLGSYDVDDHRLYLFSPVTD